MKSAMKKHLGSDNKGALILLMALICVLFTFGTQGFVPEYPEYPQYSGIGLPERYHWYRHDLCLDYRRD